MGGTFIAIHPSPSITIQDHQRKLLNTTAIKKSEERTRSPYGNVRIYLNKSYFIASRATNFPGAGKTGLSHIKDAHEAGKYLFIRVAVNT